MLVVGLSVDFVVVVEVVVAVDVGVVGVAMSVVGVGMFLFFTRLRCCRGFLLGRGKGLLRIRRCWISFLGRRARGAW